MVCMLTLIGILAIAGIIVKLVIENIKLKVEISLLKVGIIIAAIILLIIIF